MAERRVHAHLCRELLIKFLEERTEWPTAELRSLVAEMVGCSERTVARIFYDLPDEYYAVQRGNRSAMVWGRST